jgi:hypothetical protein
MIAEGEAACNVGQYRSGSIVRRRMPIRLTETHWELIKQECAMRNMPFSAYVRQAILGNLKYMRRQAIEAWGR